MNGTRLVRISDNNDTVYVLESEAKQQVKDLAAAMGCDPSEIEAIHLDTAALSAGQWQDLTQHINRSMVSESALNAILVNGIEFESAIYLLMEQAEADNYGTDGEVRYHAHAIRPADGELVRLSWQTTANWDEMSARLDDDPDDYEAAAYLSDEGNACDWDNPVSVQVE